MRALVYKEWLAARPYVGVSVLYGLLGFLSYLLRTDVMNGMAEALTASSGVGLLVTGAIVFAVGHAQVAPEMRRGHIELLDGLPVGRGSIFAAKLGVGAAVIGTLMVALVVVEVAFTQLAFGRQSFETLGPIAAAHLAGLLGFYASGLLLSWFGGFGWVLLGLGLTATFILAEASEALRPLSVLHGYAAVRFELGRPVVERWPVALWAAYAGGASAASGLLFLGPGDALVRGGSRVVPRLKTVALLGIGALLALAAAGAGVPLLSGSPAGSERVEVGRFRVLTPAGRPAPVPELLEAMPWVDAELADLFGVPQWTAPLDVELLGGGRYHAGVYTGGKVRMALGEDAVHTFAHELAHAYAHRLGGERLRRHMNALRFFNEGLAMWAAERIVPGSSESNDPFREWAGAIRRDGHHHLDPLMQDELRSRRFDGFEAYPLGFVFVEALVEEAGRDVVPCLLAQVAELPDRGLAGESVWARLSAGCGLSWPRVVAAYERRLAEYAGAWAGPARTPTGVPRRTSGGDYVFVEPAVGLERVCRFRSRPEAKVADLDEARVDDRGRCPILVTDSTTDTVSFEVGVRLSLGWVVYGPWTSHPMPE